MRSAEGVVASTSAAFAQREAQDIEIAAGDPAAGVDDRRLARVRRAGKAPAQAPGLEKAVRFGARADPRERPARFRPSPLPAGRSAARVDGLERIHQCHSFMTDCNSTSTPASWPPCSPRLLHALWNSLVKSASDKFLIGGRGDLVRRSRSLGRSRSAAADGSSHALHRRLGHHAYRLFYPSRTALSQRRPLGRLPDHARTCALDRRRHRACGIGRKAGAYRQPRSGDARRGRARHGRKRPRAWSNRSPDDYLAPPIRQSSRSIR